MPAGRVTPQQPESGNDHTDLFRSVPLARGLVRDLRVRWALEKAAWSGFAVPPDEGLDRSREVGREPF
jgi:hypothetical protein